MLEYGGVFLSFLVVFEDFSDCKRMLEYGGVFLNFLVVFEDF